MPEFNCRNMIIDHTHRIHPEIFVYPGTPSPLIEACCSLEKEGFVEHKVWMTTHTGTHVDAPAHLFENGKTLDQYPLEKFMGKTIMISCEGKQKIERSFLEASRDLLDASEFVLLYTGWQTYWESPEYMAGFPVCTSEAASWLCNFPLKGIGFDTPSADSPHAKEYSNHRLFLAHDILIYENLCNLDGLPNHPFEFCGVPLKLKHTDGAPVRAFSIL